MTFPHVHPQDSGIEPDSEDQSRCTLCQSAIGTPHAPTCEAVTKRVLVRYIFELELPSPTAGPPTRSPTAPVAQTSLSKKSKPSPRSIASAAASRASSSLRLMASRG